MFILGKKLGMTRLFSEQDQSSIPVTVIKAGPCWVTQKKTENKDGYKAIQVGFGEKSNLNKPKLGHLKQLESKINREPNFQYLREFPVEDPENFEIGDKIELDTFDQEKPVNVTGTTKAKGFQGVVKRHNFSGGPATHGTKDTHRTPGSIGSAYPEHVRKGTKMPGKMGAKTKTIQNLEIVKTDPEKDLLAVKGGIPGTEDNLVSITQTQ